LHFFHDIFETDKILDVDVRLIGEVYRGGIKVDVKT
jgi:hypothetical protein